MLKMVKVKKNKNLRIVSFDEEIITKDSAGELLSELDKKSTSIPNGKEENIYKINLDNTKKVYKDGELTNKNKKRKGEPIDQDEIPREIHNNEGQKSISEGKPKYKKKKVKISENQLIPNGGNTEEDKEPSNENEKKVKRKKKKIESETPETSKKLKSVDDELSIENPKVKTGESIRAQKRKKHAKLIEDKRLKTEVMSQQNALNYLSKWKHCRNEWKFEKLKQIWLQQNLFDISKIPNEFWETVVEYFCNSKGFIRNVVLRDALKIIEKEESTEEENTDENYLLILERARNIVQNLQE